MPLYCVFITIDNVMIQTGGLKYTLLTDSLVSVNGREYAHEGSGSSLLTELYRHQVDDWPRFFKMDTLSKTGFMATELLLKDMSSIETDSEDSGCLHAIALFGSRASLHTDRTYQDTISDADNFYPSPSLFVYTLPNIVTGEIAIRNHFLGESVFYVMEHPDASVMAFHVNCLFQDCAVDSVLTGWVDCESGDSYHCFVTMVRRADAGKPVYLEEELRKIIDNLNNE